MLNGVMGEDRIRYYRPREGRGYWEPGARVAAKFGVDASVALGIDGPGAKQAALDLNADLDKRRMRVRAGLPPVDGDARPAPYPPGTLGSFYQVHFKATEKWRTMSAATREHYERAWTIIGPRYGATLITKIAALDSERFHTEIHPSHNNSERDPQGEKKLSWHKAHLVLKHWRLLLHALVSYELRVLAPIGRISNPPPPSRPDVWVAEEIAALIEAAEALGLYAMAAAIQTGWDTMMSTPDVRLMPFDAYTPPRAGQAEGVFNTHRKKSKKAVNVASTPETDAALAAYLKRMADAGVAIGPGSMLFRRPTGAPYADRHAFKDDFAAVREKAFPGDRRQFGDMRRSGATEADLGGVDPKALGKTMANRLDQDEALQSTYVVGESKKVQDARRAGRNIHSARFRKTHSD